MNLVENVKTGFEGGRYCGNDRRFDRFFGILMVFYCYFYGKNRRLDGNITLCGSIWGK